MKIILIMISAFIISITQAKDLGFSFSCLEQNSYCEFHQAVEQEIQMKSLGIIKNIHAHGTLDKGFIFRSLEEIGHKGQITIEHQKFALNIHHLSGQAKINVSVSATLTAAPQEAQYFDICKINFVDVKIAITSFQSFELVSLNTIVRNLVDKSFTSGKALILKQVNQSLSSLLVKEGYCSRID